MCNMTREDWLNAFTEMARPEFERVKFPLPIKIRCSVGWPSTGRRSRRIGECWSNEASDDEHFEIFIRPNYQSDSVMMADILTHELCHTATPREGHGKVFKQCATKVGLVGKMRSAGFPKDDTGMAQPPQWAANILDVIGPLPGANLDGAPMNVKKQTTRLLKMQCCDCGLTFRITQKYLVERDQLRCPDPNCEGDMSYEG